MIWPRVIGQQRVKETLISFMRTNRLAHAYLFYGPDGVGKDAMAMELARVLHCEKNGEEACGECGSCTQINSLQHPDVKLVTALPVGKGGETSDDPPLAKLTPDVVKVIQEQYRTKGANPYHQISIPGSTVIKINSIRELRREAAMSTRSGRRRVIIVSRADEMNEAASNTILKTLEEPAGYTMLILTTSHPDQLLSTIRSRCQLVRFDPLREEDIREALMQRNGLSAADAALVARLAGGSYFRALELMQENLARERQEVLEFIRHTLSGNSVATAEDIERITAGSDRTPHRRFLQLILLWFRDALVTKHGGEVINVDQRDELKRFVAKFPAADLHGVNADVERAISLLERNVYIRLIFLQLVVQLRKNILQPDAVTTH